MNMNEENFAYKVRHALNEKLDDIPENITQRLEQARRIAVSRKKRSSPLYARVFQQVFAGAGGYFFTDRISWMGKLGISLPVLALAIGMAGIFHHEQQRQMREIADIDIAVLSDELPPSAYADSGFKAFVADRSVTGV